MQSEPQRSQVLDAWDYRAPFARFHIQWDETNVTPAFEQEQAYAIAVQELGIKGTMDVWAHREVLLSCASEHFGVAEAVPAWVIVAVGIKTGEAQYLTGIQVGAGAVVQLLIHARSGEVLLGTALPVKLNRG